MYPVLFWVFAFACDPVSSAFNAFMAFSMAFFVAVFRGKLAGALITFFMGIFAGLAQRVM